MHHEVQVTIVVEVSEVGRGGAVVGRKPASRPLKRKEAGLGRTHVHVEEGTVRVKRVRKHGIHVPVAVDIARVNRLRIRTVHTKSRDTLIGKRERGDLELVDHQEVLTLRSGTGKAVAFRKEDIQVAVVVDVGTFHTFGPALRVGECTRGVFELLSRRGGKEEATRD
mgnify:CR=1 FL=1